MLGHLLARISHDYVVQPGSYLHLGLKIGLAAGAVVAACQVVGHWRPSASGIDAMRGLSWALLVTTGGVLLCAMASYGAYRWGWMDTSHWRLPNPSRHAMLVGVQGSLHVCAALGIAGASVWVLRRRWTCASR